MRFLRSNEIFLLLSIFGSLSVLFSQIINQVGLLGMYINILYDIFRKKNNVILNVILLKVCHPQKIHMSSWGKKTKFAISDILLGGTAGHELCSCCVCITLSHFAEHVKRQVTAAAENNCYINGGFC